MAVPARLALFATALVVVFALAFAVGRAMEPGQSGPGAVQADGQDGGGFGGHDDVHGGG